MCIVGSCLTICVGESIVKLALTHKHVYHLEPLQMDIVLIWLDCYCAWASRVTCQPKIPVSPRSQSTQDPSQPKIPVNPRSQPIWFMRNPYQLNFPIPTWVSVILIWHMHIFLSLKNAWAKDSYCILCNLFSALISCSYVAFAYCYIFCYIIEFYDTNSAS